MEFHEKLQELRKQKGLTQEELAQVLYVSRTAVSKWESGRGMPSIESLKAISTYFSVTVDELLSGEALLRAAEDDCRQKERHIRNLVFGALDCSMALLLFLPVFGQHAEGAVQAVPVLALTRIQPYLQAAYVAAIAAMMLCGMLTFALQNCRTPVWLRSRSRLSLLLHAAMVILFIASRQPYAAVFAFVLLMIKALMAAGKP